MATKKRARTVTARARKDDDKQARRELIVQAAHALFQDAPYAKISMEAVAQKSALAKGTVYLYFGTKEELFLAVLQSLLGAWFDDVEKRLSTASGPLGAIGLIQIFASTVSERSALSRLIADAGALEQNVGFEAASAYKRWLQARLTQTGAELEARFQVLAKGEGFRVLIHLYTMIVGMSQLTQPSAIILDVVETLELKEFALRFESELMFVVYHYLLGLEHRGSQPAADPKRKARAKKA